MGLLQGLKSCLEPKQGPFGRGFKARVCANGDFVWFSKFVFKGFGWICFLFVKLFCLLWFGFCFVLLFSKRLFKGF